MHSYPHDLVSLLREHWEKPIAADGNGAEPAYEKFDALPPLMLMEQMLSICYQASMMRDEDRPVRFRTILREPARFAPDNDPASGLQRLVFAKPVPFAPNELRRLAQAAVFERTLIGARENREGELEIWGIIHSGSGWLRAMEGSRCSFEALPPSLVISVTGPGHLAVAKGSVTVIGLSSGRVILPAPTLVLANDAAEAREPMDAELLSLHKKARAKAGDAWARLDPQLLRLIRERLGLRMINAIRGKHHGGTVVILPRRITLRASSLNSYIRVKYMFSTSDSRRRLYTLLLRLVNSLAESVGKERGPDAVAGWDEYMASKDPVVEETDEALGEQMQLLAGMAASDGAVVLARPMEMVGFGGEISGRLPHVAVVARASDPAGDHFELEDTSGVGTRHRSVYRLCNGLPEAVALVISQDGDVRIVMKKGARVTYWEHTLGGGLGLYG